MRNDQLYTYCRTYFSLVGATFHPADDFALAVELPRDVDKELTDRPFYWMWLETLRETPPPSYLYLLFDGAPPSPAFTALLPERQKPEHVLPGSYRLQKIQQSAKLRGSFAVAYERTDAPATLWPSVLMNVKVSLVSDRQKDELHSLLYSVKHSTVKSVDMAHWSAISLLDERPRTTRLVPLPIDFDEAFTRILARVEHELAHRDHRWAKDAAHRLQHELSEMDRYYASLDDDLRNEAEKQLRVEELTWRIAPRVEVEPVQVAILYRTEP